MHFLLLFLLLLPLPGRLWEVGNGWREVGEDHAGKDGIGRIVFSPRYALIFLLDCTGPIQPKVVKVSSSLDSSKFPIENILSAEVGTDWFAAPGSTGEGQGFVVQVALFDMPNSYQFNILSISIFSEISLSISISIFSKNSLSISIYSRTALSISISIFSW